MLASEAGLPDLREFLKNRINFVFLRFYIVGLEPGGAVRRSINFGLIAG